MGVYHIPVLLRKSVELLNVRPGGIYVDVTFGGGGHSKEILSHLGSGKLIAFDRDADAAINRINDPRFVLLREDFKFIEKALHAHGLEQVDGILADLGVSSHQFDSPGRGFSFRFDAQLDMRMDNRHEQTAADLLNEMEADELQQIFSRFGEIRNARKLAEAIVSGRQTAPITTTSELEAVIVDCIPKTKKSKYLAKLYQAIRIRLNGELDSLTALLQGSARLLKPGGRLVLISYHSLEDRMVKYFMRSGNISGKLEKDFYGRPLTPWKLITRKAIQASEEEVEQNPRARSARLRAVEKKQ